MFNFKNFFFSLVFFVAYYPSFLFGFDLSNSYSFKSDKWLAKKVPEGFSYLCIPCESEIRLQITAGPFNSAITPELFSGFSNSEQQRLDFAEQTIRSQIPLNLDPEIEVLRNSYGSMFGINVLAFNALVEMGPTVAWDTSYVGVFKNRIVKVTINYIDGALDDVARNALNEILGSLSFKSD